MNLTELDDALKTLGYPVAYSHFISTPKKPSPPPPFICYLATDSNVFSADNKPIHESVNVDVEFYTSKKDLIAENKIKQLLKDNELSWLYVENYIKDERVFQCVFSITLI